MDKIMIDIREESKQIRRIFEDKDYVTLETLLSTIEELDDKISDLEDKYEELENNLEENYKQKSAYELYDVNERDFH